VPRLTDRPNAIAKPAIAHVHATGAGYTFSAGGRSTSHLATGNPSRRLKDMLVRWSACGW